MLQIDVDTRKNRDVSSSSLRMALKSNKKLNMVHQFVCIQTDDDEHVNHVMGSVS